MVHRLGFDSTLGHWYFRTLACKKALLSQPCSVCLWPATASGLRAPAVPVDLKHKLFEVAASKREWTAAHYAAALAVSTAAEVEINQVTNRSLSLAATSWMLWWARQNSNL